MSTASPRAARPAGGGLPAVGTAVLVAIGPWRHRGTVVDHRNGQAWVEFLIEGTEDPRHMLLSADQLEYPD